MEITLLAALTARVRRAAAYAWASPNTIFGLAVGLLLRGRFQRVSGVIEIDGPAVERALKSLWVPAAALTLGHVVFAQNQRLLDRTRVHERVHVRQYERWGPFFVPAYLFWFAFLSFRGRDGYRENPFEIEAYDIDDPASRPW